MRLPSNTSTTRPGSAGKKPLGTRAKVELARGRKIRSPSSGRLRNAVKRLLDPDGIIVWTERPHRVGEQVSLNLGDL